MKAQMLESQIIKFLSNPHYIPQDLPGLRQRLRLSAHEIPELQRALFRLEKNGQIARIKKNRYTLPPQADLVPGRIRINRQGAGTLRPDDRKLAEIRIPAEATANALHGDHVLVRRDVLPRGYAQRESLETTGKVIRILERARRQLVGTLQRSKQFLYVIPDDPRIPHDFYVTPLKEKAPPQRPGGPGPGPSLPASVGDKVVVELSEWTSRHTNPEGRIIQVLGKPDKPGVDLLSIIKHYQLPLEFPKAVLHESAKFADEIQPQDLEGRVDCREHRVITIDPDDAKDFDDAICLQPVDRQHWKLWVHIADVSHYVKPGTALDLEARRRGNSTYLVDRVIPMLPEALSNELCSLKPRVDRLTKCAEFLLASDGRVLKTQFYAALICSQRRLTYAEALAILQRAPADPIEQMLYQANQLAQRLRRRRFQLGSLDLDFPALKLRLDEQGRVARMEKEVNDLAHQLIEEFMLLANEATAVRLRKSRSPAIYRVHELPDPERLQEYAQEVRAHRLPCGNLQNRREVQKLLAKLKQSAVGTALKIGFLRSLKRARYAVDALGHYGLAKADYTHFTSPIRRYADLAVHRALFDHKKNLPSLNFLAETADHISRTEQNSAEAERDSIEVKLFAFLEEQISSGQLISYRALVTDLRNFGFFIDVPDLGLSGFVHLSTIEDDFYALDPGRSRLVGRRTRRTIQMGNEIAVQVAKVDKFKKQVDFCLSHGRFH